MRGAASADQSNSWSTQFALKAGDEGAIYFCSLPLSIYINVLVKEMGALISHGWMHFWKKMKKWKKALFNLDLGVVLEGSSMAHKECDLQVRGC